MDIELNIYIMCRFFPDKATIPAVDILNELVEVCFTVVLPFCRLVSLNSSQLKILFSLRAKVVYDLVC